MPKVIHNTEKIQKQKKIIGIIAVVLLIIVMIIAIIIPLNFYIWVPISLAIFAVANIIMRRIGKTLL
jgi:amino acid transporter